MRAKFLSAIFGSEPKVMCSSGLYVLSGVYFNDLTDAEKNILSHKLECLLEMYGEDVFITKGGRKESHELAEIATSSEGPKDTVNEKIRQWIGQLVEQE